MAFVVLFDACVLYPAPLRDLLMRLATTRLFAAKWTDQIHDEWTRNLLTNRPELAEQLPRTRELMNAAVSDCLVTGYAPLITALELPDPDDRHVLAAAVRASAQVIVTFNLKDFPSEALSRYGIEALHPDVFVEHQLDLDQDVVIAAAKSHRASLRNPPKAVDEYLDTLAGQGLPATADKLREFAALL